MKQARRRPYGFSLIELLAAAAILGILASVAVPVAQTAMRREKERELRQALRDIRRGLDAYKLASLAGHIPVNPGESGYPPSLSALVTGIPDAKNAGAPAQYFLRRIPRDPFFADRTVAADKTWSTRRYDSPPEAPQEGPDVFDVYSRSAQSGLNGVPYAEW